MPADVVGLTVTEIGGLIAATATAIGGWATFRKLKPERDTLVLTSAQGATTILNNLVQTLYAEIERREEVEKELREEDVRKGLRIAELEAQVSGFQRRFGTRASDPDREAE